MLNTLTAFKVLPPPCRGALASRLLLALICDPEIQNQEHDCEVSCLLFTFLFFLTPFLIFFLLQALLQEYLDASCSLLFELLLLGQEVSFCWTSLVDLFYATAEFRFVFIFQASTHSSADNFLSVGWILRTVQPHPHLVTGGFIVN